jgi:hypothetical protein
LARRLDQTTAEAKQAAKVLKKLSPAFVPEEFFEIARRLSARCRREAVMV